MSSDDKTYTPELKVKVAKEALTESKNDLDSLAKKYDVPVSAILMWKSQLEKHGPDVFEENKKTEDTRERINDEDQVDVEVSDTEVAKSIEFGVMEDKLNYKRLVFWSVLGIILVLIFVESLRNMYQSNVQMSQDNASDSIEYYPVNQMKKEARETLSTFGVVNLEEGVYRIPIDSAMNEIVADEE